MDVLATLKNGAYRIARKVVIVNKSQFYDIALTDIAPAVRCGDNFRFMLLEQESQLTGAIRKFVGAEPCSRLDGELLLCVVAYIHDQPIGYVWLAFGEVPAKHNHDGNPATGLPLSLPNDTVYLFNAFVSPGHRGLRIYPALVAQCGTLLHDRGYKRLFLATEYTNQSALRSVDRMGFDRSGVAKLVKVGPFTWASYPNPPLSCGVRIGRYVGDSA